MFRCPSAKTVDEWRETGLRYPAEFWLYSSYGINDYAGHAPAPGNPRDKVPGLKRHRRSAETVELSRIALPVVSAMCTSSTLPVPGSTVASATPEPVIRSRRATYG